MKKRIKAVLTNWLVATPQIADLWRFSTQNECNHSLEWLEKNPKSAHIVLGTPSIRAFLNAFSQDGGGLLLFLTHGFGSNDRCWHKTGTDAFDDTNALLI